jgi:hypothetical protein
MHCYANDKFSATGKGKLYKKKIPKRTRCRKRLGQKAEKKENFLLAKQRHAEDKFV